MKKWRKILVKYLNKINVNDPIYNLILQIEFALNETRGSVLSVVKQKLNAIFIRNKDEYKNKYSKNIINTPVDSVLLDDCINIKKLCYNKKI